MTLKVCYIFHVQFNYIFLNETVGINLKYTFPENSSLLSSVIGVRKEFQKSESPSHPKY